MGIPVELGAEGTLQQIEDLHAALADVWGSGVGERWTIDGSQLREADVSCFN